MDKQELKNVIIDMITNCVDEVLAENNESDGQEPLSIDSHTCLFGKSGLLDSNGLVAAIVGVEEKIFCNLGYSVVIADERALSQKKSPFKTIGSLTDYISMLIEEQS